MMGGMYGGGGQLPLSKVIFNKHDKDKNGSLDTQEFHAMVKDPTCDSSTS